MRIIIGILALLMSMTATAQRYEVSKDEKTGFTVYKGIVTQQDLTAGDFKWFGTGIDGYRPDAASISYLEKNLPQYKMVIFLGTWCEDSHILVPRLFRVIKDAKYPADKYLMYGVDREKTALNGEDKIYDIKHVPTVILFHDGKEIGRIVETTFKSVEADLAAMIKKHQEGK